jgi:hypothetical protein
MSTLSVRFFALSASYSTMVNGGHRQHRFNFSLRKVIVPGVWLIEVHRAGPRNHGRVRPSSVIFRCWRIPLPRWDRPARSASSDSSAGGAL